MGKRAPALQAEDRPSDPAALREHVLDMIDQLAVLASEQGEVDMARTPWACWGRISPDMAAAPAGREVVWIDTPDPPAD